MADIKYVPAGVRLHLKEMYYKLTNRDLNKKYHLSFESIPDGLKAEKMLKNFKIPFSSIPVPDDIYEACGVAIVVKEYENIVEILTQNRIKVDVFIYENDKPKKVFGTIENHKGCGI